MLSRSKRRVGVARKRGALPKYYATTLDDSNWVPRSEIEYRCVVSIAVGRQRNARRVSGADRSLPLPAVFVWLSRIRPDRPLRF